MPIHLTTENRIAETSSKGNQEKWREGDRWYKLDLFGYEGLAETVTSSLLQKTTVAPTGRIKLLASPILPKRCAG